MLFRTALVAIVALVLSACSGGSKFPDTIVVKDEAITPVIANSELVVGENRFVLGVLSPEQRPIVDARVNLKFFDLSSPQQVVKFETKAVSRVPARDSGLTEEVVHIHADGTRHVHVNVSEDVGVYTAPVTFDRAGPWGVEIAVDADKPKVKQTLRVRFDVLEKGTVPAVGEPAPRSRNLTVADVADISEIDSSARPSPEMHTTTIADAIVAGRPTLVLFAVPGFCSSALCGPELEIMRKAYPKYRDRVEFIHVEFFKKPGSPDRVPSDAAVEWRLRTEPWFFLIDAKGIISARFEGPTTLSELEEALDRVLAAANR